MRSAVFALSTLALTGCVSRFVLTEYLEEIVCDQSYFLDSDGDGWGDDATDPVVACDADPATGFTATNGRDCRDDDEQVTGRVASACGDELVAGGSLYEGVILGDSEYIVVYGDTTPVWSEHAVSACGPWGWGGQLATFDTPEDLAAVTGLLDDVITTEGYAGYIGISVAESRESWDWEDGSALDFLQVGWCDGVQPTIRDAALGLDQLALVRPSGSTQWCLGTPEQADDDYDAREAHFVCERVVPSPADWVFHAENQDEASDDTGS